MAAKKYVQALTQYLAGSGVVVGATSIVLTSLTDIYTNAISSITAFGDKGYITLEPDTTNEEAATFTSVTVNANGTVTLGGVSTVLAQSPYTETSGLVRQHSGGTKVVITDNVAFWNTFGNKNNDELLTGRWSTGVAPSANNDLVNKVYADGLAIAGAPNASTSVKGIGQVSVAPVSPTTPIFVGDNDTRVPTIAQTASLVGNNTDIAVGSGNKFVTQTGLQHSAERYVTTTGSANAYVATLVPAPTSLTNGMTLTLIANFSNTGAVTLAVNGLGATPAITKYGTTALIANDIVSGQAFTVTWDGTRWQLQSPVGNAPVTSQFVPIYKCIATSKNAADASATQTLAHGVGKIPLFVRIECSTNIGGSSVSVVWAKAVYNGTTQVSQSTYMTGSFGYTTDATFTLNTALAAATQSGVVTFDATNINIAWTKTGSPTGIYLQTFEVFA